MNKIMKETDPDEWATVEEDELFDGDYETAVENEDFEVGDVIPLEFNDD